MRRVVCVVDEALPELVAEVAVSGHEQPSVLPEHGLTAHGARGRAYCAPAIHDDTLLPLLRKPSRSASRRFICANW